MAYGMAELGALLSGNAYPGRGIVLGRSQDGRQLALAYFIMGRSENSRNRVFAEEGDEVRIYPADAAKVEDPRLIHYSPIRRFGDYLIVTNGDQTDTVYEYLRNGMGFAEAMATRRFEPDAPNFTPRIAGLLQMSGDFHYLLAILRAQDPEGQHCEWALYHYEAVAGLGHYLHTYLGDGDPLPSFRGDPERVRIPDSAEDLAREIWENLDAENKISLYVRYIDMETGEMRNVLRNRYQRRGGIS